MKSVHLLYGTDEFQVTDAVATLIRQRPSYDRVLLEGTCEMSRLNDLINGMSLFAAPKLIVFKSPWFLLKKVSDATAIIAMLHDCEQTDHEIILYVPGKSLDGRLKLVSELKKKASSHEYHAFKEWEGKKVTAWIQNRLSHYQLSGEFSVIQSLHDIGGTNLRVIDQSIQTIQAYIGQRTTVTQADIAELQATKAVSLFDGFDALRLNQVDELVRVIMALNDAGIDPIATMAGLVSQCRLYIQLLDLATRLSPDEVAKTVGKHPFYVSKLLGDLKKRQSLDRLCAYINRFAYADRAIKSGRQKPQEALLQAVSNQSDEHIDGMR